MSFPAITIIMMLQVPSLSSVVLILFLSQYSLALQISDATIKRTRSSYSLFRSNSSLILSPPINKVGNTTAIVLVPGCQLEPRQYEQMAKSIQENSDRPVWISIPKMLLNMPNPLDVPRVVRESLTELQQAGYGGTQTYVGGHSLGGVFLPNVIESQQGLDASDILGFIRLGAFQDRSDDVSSMRQLTICGNLDGMVRTSRIAEDFYRNIIARGDSDATRLQHSTVLIEGMNHFAFLQGKAPFMKQFRDLHSELPQQEASKEVAATIAEFIDTDLSPKKARSLLNRIEKTHQYLQPMLDAMELEGSYLLHQPNFKDEGNPDSTFDQQSSQWGIRAQESIAPALKGDCSYGTHKNEIHRCWYLNPLGFLGIGTPFYHPSVVQEQNEEGNMSVQLHTVSELVYDIADRVFDGGFFSNAPTEIRCKMNSPQSILHSIGDETAPFQPRNHMAAEINAQTIEWAISKAPAKVRERYLKNGVRLTTGSDIPKMNGAGWIWSSLEFRKSIDEKGRECRVLHSPTMNTPLDHPIPNAGGKAYCKLLSPTKALDWIYTDSLRSSPSVIEFLANQLITPENRFSTTEEQAV